MKKLVVLALLAFASICAAETQTWQIDPNHTASQFSVRHLGISTVRGQFMKTTGTVVYDPADPSKTQVDVTIDTASVDTRVEFRDKDVRSPRFLDVEKYPTMTFKSKKTESTGSGKLKITGDLTLHGVTKEVVLDVDGPSAPVSAMGGMRMGASATTKIDRNDFGITSMSGMVGDEIQITLDVEVTRPAAK